MRRIANSAPSGKKAITIPAPLSGSVKPLEQVNDSLFSRFLYGDGIAIELAGNNLIAPFKSKVTMLPATKHAIQLTAANGLQLYIQLGMESDKLMGEGFSSKLKLNQIVERNQTLIEFDLLKLRTRLPSLLSPITIVNCEKLTAIVPHYGRVTQGENAIMKLYI